MARPRRINQIDIPKRAVETTLALLDKREAITLAKVAERIGCKPPALYNHYANKQELLRAVQCRGFQMMAEWKREAAIKAKTPMERLEQGGIAYVHFALKHAALYELMFSPPADAQLAHNPFDDQVGSLPLALLREAIINCQQENSLPHYDPDLLAFTLWSSVHGIASLILQNRIPFQSDHAVQNSQPKPDKRNLQEIDILVRNSIHLIMNCIKKPTG